MGVINRITNTFEKVISIPQDTAAALVGRLYGEPLLPALKGIAKSATVEVVTLPFGLTKDMIMGTAKLAGNITKDTILNARILPQINLWRQERTEKIAETRMSLGELQAKLRTLRIA